MDYILNGQPHGSVAARLMASNFDVGMLRPFIGKRKKTFVSLTTGHKRSKKTGKLKPILKNSMLVNATGTLLYEEWKQIDRAVVRAANPEQVLFNEIRARNSVTIPNGLGTTVLESAMIGDITPAEINMSGLARADSDRPLMDIVGVPLPIIHKDFVLDLRSVAVARKSGYPLDDALPTDAAGKVGEEVEKLAVGVSMAYSFAGRHIYGAISFPQRLTIELSDPTDVGWEPADLVNEIVLMQKASRDVGYRGPWRMYVGSGWMPHFAKDYSAVKGTNTLQQRIEAIGNIEAIVDLDFLPEDDILLIKHDPRVARAIIAMPLTTFEWTQQGGWEIMLKVATIAIPQFRADFYDGTGIVHGSVPGGFAGS